MPIDLELIRATEFVRLSAHGHIDYEASKAALEFLARACLKRGMERALLDLRALPVPPKPIFTPAELAELVETFRTAGFRQHHRLAVLYKTDPHHGARLLAFISRMKGWQVRAFPKFEEALTWLSEEEAKKPADPGEDEIPIRVGKSRDGAVRIKKQLKR